MANQQSLFRWFDNLSSRTLDLVGDYAGDELFIIEGDSLLLHCFSDDTLDFTHGLQLLHATYLVEKFLEQVRRRKGVFHIVFFSSHAQICIPENTSETLWPKYRLAREAILQHLLQNIPAAVASIKVKCFQTYQSDDFKDYLQSVGAYFLMCHDGTSPTPRDPAGDHKVPREADISLSDEEPYSALEPGVCFAAAVKVCPTKILLRSMIHWFVSHGYNISILNSVEFRDSKILSMILEGSMAHAREVYGSGTNEYRPSHESSTISSSDPCHTPGVQKLSRLSLKDGSTEKTATTMSDILKRLDGYQCLGQQNMDRVVTEQLTGNLSQRECATVLAIGLMPRSIFSDVHGLIAAAAMLLHTAILSECELSERATAIIDCQHGQQFLGDFSNTLVHLFTSELWADMVSQVPSSCDLSDIIDGNLFMRTLQVLKLEKNIDSFSTGVRERFQRLASLAVDLFDIHVQTLLAYSTTSKKKDERAAKWCEGRESEKRTRNNDISVLPFQNPVIDAHLKPVGIILDDSADNILSNKVSRIFQELSHWHNHQKLLTARPSPPLTEWEKTRIFRRNQLFMTDVRKYAASLTNSVGGFLDPEPVFAKRINDKQSKRAQHHSFLKDQGNPDQMVLTSRGKHNQKKPSVKSEIAARTQSKQTKAVEKHLAAWRLMVDTFDREHDYLTRYKKVKQYLSELSKERRDAVELEVMAYIANTLVLAWKQISNTPLRDSSIGIVALIWSTCQQIANAKDGITREVATCIQDILKALNLPIPEIPYQETRKLSFEFADYTIKVTDLSIRLSAHEFQLLHAGPYLDRSMGSAADSRVHDFQPDQWQREVLDEIDARRSLFVVAPTSAGKTFISFYAMKQILEDDDEGVLVYVAPTKALVNQIAAEIQARFSKTYANVGKCVWAIHTRDYRINNPTSCQILVTVPHMLQIMLLAPSNAQSWSPRVKRIIFDEVHCIGQAEDGVVWEQLLLLAPCPIIALSATVGNPEEFQQWLGMTQNANGLELKMIQHKARYSELRKFIYSAPEKFAFNGFSTSPQIASLGLDGSPNMAFLHPVASLIDRSRGLPSDLTLEPRDCYLLWKAMKDNATKAFPMDEALDPSVTLPGLIKKADVIHWEAQLKASLKHWMNQADSPFEAVVQDLSTRMSTQRQQLQVSGEIQENSGTSIVNPGSLLETTLPLLCSLHDKDALPALLFNYDRSKCEEICEHLLTQLEASERHWKATSPAWKKKIANFEEWKKRQNSQKQKKPVKETKRMRKRGGTGDEDVDKLEKAEMRLEMLTLDPSRYESFDPSDPISEYHFADEKKLSGPDFEGYALELRKREVKETLIRALKRGIGVHHAGMNRKYRQVCEMLFRKGYLRVVIATGTLALGINMPCKTVVFSGDSVYLTALNFRQAAGRAGRRGFDFLGNVVFQCIPYAKVCRLVSSRLPDLNGHFPISTSLVLRLFILLHESKQAPYAVKAINSILSCPRIYLGGPESKHTVLHHLRFSIEYLRRNSLLDADGTPLNFAGAVSHLYYTENSSFAFHTLLRSGYFHATCQHIRTKPKETLRTLILVMAHLFGRHLLRPSVLESFASRNKSTSVVILPELPRKAAKTLRSHNENTLKIYSTYVKTFVDQHVTEPDCMLPLTKIKCGGDASARDISPSMEFLKPTKVTSSFIALSGHRDQWSTIPELCQTVRSGVWLEQAVIPHLHVSPGRASAPLNAYLYDFFKHGNSAALVTENRVRKGDLWFLLSDFSLVLATIVTSFRNYLKMAPGADVDHLDVMGVGEKEDFEDHLDIEECAITGSVNEDAVIKQSPATRVATRLPKAEKTEVADNWDDDLSDVHTEETDSPKSEDGVAVTVNRKQKSRMTKDIGACAKQPNRNPTLESEGLPQVLKAFEMLREEFNDKFKAMWA
ncbi:DEAD/DEAH box helicase [Aspergillus crustosus]